MGSRIHTDPLDSGSSESMRGTFRNALLSERLCRMEFWTGCEAVGQRRDTIKPLLSTQRTHLPTSFRVQPEPFPFSRDPIADLAQRPSSSRHVRKRPVDN